MIKKVHAQILTIAFGIGFFASAALLSAQDIPLAPETSELKVKPTTSSPADAQLDLPKLPEAPKEIKAPKEEIVSVPTPKIPEPSIGEPQAAPAEKMAPMPSMVDSQATQAKPTQEPQEAIIDRLSPFEQPAIEQKSVSAPAAPPSQEPVKIAIPEMPSHPIVMHTSLTSTATEEKRTTCDVHMEHMSQRLAQVEQLLANVMNQLATINQTLQKQAAAPASAPPIIITTGPVHATQPCVALTTTTTAQPQPSITPVVSVPQQAQEIKSHELPKSTMMHKKPMRRRHMMMTKRGAHCEHHEAMPSSDKSSTEKSDSSTTLQEVKKSEQKREQPQEHAVEPTHVASKEGDLKKEDQPTTPLQKPAATKKEDTLDLSDLDFNEELPLAESL